MTTIERNLALIHTDSKALVVGNPEAFTKYGETLSKHASQVTLLDAESQAVEYRNDVSLVIVLGRSIRETHAYYSKCNPFKECGVPVVFGIEERTLIFSPPSWQNADLSIQGMFYLASMYLSGLPRKGKYIEFGVFDGRSFTIACHALQGVCNGFFGFDSFCGIIGSQKEERRLYQENAYYANIETFWHNMKVAGVDHLPIHVVRGAFQATLPGRTPADYGIDHISVVHIDSDIYEAALLALEFAAPCLTTGALVLFDEYHAFAADNNKGERRALREWLELHPEFSAEPYRNYTAVSRSYIIHRDGGVSTKTSEDFS